MGFPYCVLSACLRPSVLVLPSVSFYHSVYSCSFSCLCKSIYRVILLSCLFFLKKNVSKTDGKQAACGDEQLS